MVYADWLEERGKHVRAALLRGQAAEAPTERLAALAAQTPVGWRALVADPPLEACGVKFRFRCPKQWAELAPTERAEVRHCGACDRDVHYAISVGEARGHARLGRCVALDITAARWRDDLAPPYDWPCEVCGADRVRDDCDHCGHADRVMTVGLVA